MPPEVPSAFPGKRLSRKALARQVKTSQPPSRQFLTTPNRLLTTVRSETRICAAGIGCRSPARREPRRAPLRPVRARSATGTRRPSSCRWCPNRSAGDDVPEWPAASASGPSSMATRRPKKASEFPRYGSTPPFGTARGAGFRGRASSAASTVREEGAAGSSQRRGRSCGDSSGRPDCCKRARGHSGHARAAEEAPPLLGALEHAVTGRRLHLKTRRTRARGASAEASAAPWSPFSSCARPTSSSASAKPPRTQSLQGGLEQLPHRAPAL